jgi:Domain of unknown function (DUF4136)
MSRISTLLKAAAPLALLAVSACAQPGFNAQVKRFQAMPAPQGQTFAIVSADPALSKSLEFSQYAGLVSTKLSGLGYSPAASPEAATLLVKFGYGVDKGKERQRMSSSFQFGLGFGSGYGGYGGWGYSPWGYPYGGRYGRHSAYALGWYDPWAFGGYGYDDPYDNYTVYTSKIELSIEKKGEPVRAFEGSAQALSTTDNLTKLVPNLVEAIFTGFPGNSGETVKITVPPPPKTRS